MKTLKLSAIALFLLCIYSACTKSSNTLDGQVASTRTGSPGNIGNSDVDPSLIVLFNPNPAVQDQSTTVTGTFDASTGVAIPNCGKLQLFQMVNGAWVMEKQVDVTTSVHAVSIDFTPTVAGDSAYEFKVHYIASGCAGFNTVFSNIFYLDVISACHGLSITGSATAAPSAQAGYYDFTVNYVVNTCGVDYTHLKTQGGLTAWTYQVGAFTPGAQYWEVGNGPNPNTIIKWEETAPLPGNTKTYSVTFQKAWSGTGPVTLTGAWSVKADINGTEVATASCDPIVYQ